MFKNALVSVSDKTGLEEFLRPYAEKGMRIVSSGGTAKYLEERGFQVVKVSEQTGFPEVMGGRVKTLHPNIHMPLLQRADIADDQQILKQYDLQAFDLVVVNLYPFKQGLSENKTQAQMVELIDIGGPTLLRASAKNFASNTVVCDPEDYDSIGQQSSVDLETRKKLAAKVFAHVSDYDRHIAAYLGEDDQQTLSGSLHKTLRYGENPQQQAWWYQSQATGLHQAKILQGKELSYNNLLDLDAAVQCLRLFPKEACVISVKHNNPCGVATASNIAEALAHSLKADSVSVFGGIIALNQEVTASCAEQLTDLFLECVVAPSFSSEAQQLLQKKKNLRVLQWPALLENSEQQMQIRTIAGGFLMQSQDQVHTRNDHWRVVAGEVSAQDWQGLEFAWRVCAALKSNAIAVTGHTQSYGLGMGQVNRVDAVEQAFARANKFHGDHSDRFLASDAFFPFPDSIEMAAKFGVRAIIQPGGSIKDEAVIAKAKELSIPMVFTGSRHFRH